MAKKQQLRNLRTGTVINVGDVVARKPDSAFKGDPGPGFA